jgi:uncharacterized protein
VLVPLLTVALLLAPTPLHRTGALPVSSCPEEAISAGGIPRPREYLRALVHCMDATWSAHFRRAGLAYRAPAVRFAEEPVERICGVPWPSGAAAFYCTTDKTLVLPLQGHWIEGREDLYPFKVAAHEYGHHVQQWAGLRRGYERRAAARPARTEEYGRRYELQADCLAGAFIGSVWDSLGRTTQDWSALVDATRAAGDEEGRRSHGTGASRAHWLRRGFTAASPSACDTWSAPAGRVS